MDKFHSVKLRHGRYGGIDVIGHGTYPRHSVLAGQTSTVFIENYPTEREAKEAHPEADGYESKWTAPQVSLSHLPDEDDQRPGGAWPDDIE
jgi:hypothetical protein